MSTATLEDRQAVSVPTGQRLPRIKPTVAAIREAMATRVANLPRRDERIQFNLGENDVIVVDMATGTVCDQPAGDPAVTVIIEPLHLARIMNGVRDPRSLQLFGIIQFRGGVESGVRLCDELANRHFPRQENFTDMPLPTPTTDRELARRQIEVFGYCIIKDALSKDDLESLRTRLDEQAAAEAQVGVDYYEGGRGASEDRRGFRSDHALEEASEETIAPNQRVWLLHNKGEPFLKLLENSVTAEFVPEYLDEDFPLLGQFSANIVGPGSEVQFIHQDQHPVQPCPPDAIAVNCLYLLDDFTEENGGTRIIPGSHITERGLAPDNIYTQQGTVAAVAPAGSAIVFETKLWHGAGINTTNKRRRAIILLNQRSWTRTVNNGILGVHPDVLPKMSDKVKSLFGFRVTGGLGSIQTEPEGSFVAYDPDQLVLELHPTKSR